jgi:hypothetical protein
MARTQAEIFQELLAIKEIDVNLSGLTSTSVTAQWTNTLNDTALAISLFEELQDQFLVDLEYQKTSTPVYTGAWWNDKILNLFQYAPSDTDKGVLQIDDNSNISYPITDESKRIIKFVATKRDSTGNRVSIKMAKDDGNGNPEQLTEDEITAVSQFISDIQLVGELMDAVSFPPDVLNVELDIYINGMVVASVVESNINNAVTSYLQNLEFDGLLRVSSLVDELQKVEGVIDVFVATIQATPNGGAVETFDRIYNTKAGFATYDVDNSIINIRLEQ